MEREKAEEPRDCKWVKLGVCRNEPAHPIECLLCTLTDAVKHIEGIMDAISDVQIPFASGYNIYVRGLKLKMTLQGFRRAFKENFPDTYRKFTRQTFVPTIIVPGGSPFVEGFEHLLKERTEGTV